MFLFWEKLKKDLFPDYLTTPAFITNMHLLGVKVSYLQQSYMTCSYDLVKGSLNYLNNY